MPSGSKSIGIRCLFATTHVPWLDLPSVLGGAIVTEARSRIDA
jgi:hypothetical protein